MDPLEKAILLHVLCVLDYCEWNKSEASRVLGICLTTTKRYSKIIEKTITFKKMYYKQKKKEFSCWPTNEYRIWYMDDMINRIWPVIK